MSRIPRPHLGIMAVMLPFVILLLLLITLDPAKAMSSGPGEPERITVTTADTGERVFLMQNERVACSITFTPDGRLLREVLAGQHAWLAGYDARNVRLELDGGFAWELVWNSWRSPGHHHNSANPVTVDHTGFRYDTHHVDGDTLVITMVDAELGFAADLCWTLADEDFAVRRRVLLCDPAARGHRLVRVWQRRGVIHDTARLLKTGEYGQPVAFTVQDGGAFLGLEWPAATNTIEPVGCGAVWLECVESLERTVGAEGIAGEWCVAAVTPEPYVRLWFDRYCDTIRVAPLAPYLLYNSWYDIRSRRYVMEHLTGEERDVMTSETILRIARDFRTRFCDPYGIALDAFVLDDGWDIYASDWVLRREEFPGGLRPVVDELAAMGTTLGIWFGPTGGYSYRQDRIDWMGAHGYEVTANNMLCVGGTRYHDLLKRRNLDFIAQHGVGYFKWDGIQFACNQPDHGHPVGLASRRAILENVADLSATMRAADPDIYLNITSGTWLSPWWLKIADMIWMQGYDYGYAGVPSLSARDAAMTYRDIVLHDDFVAQDCWFPLANLMTHGIIKGHLQKLGGEAEPLDRFTDNALLYFARGVAMWELYVSPNLLDGGEWEAIAQSVLWAKDRFDILKQTVMIGGSPAKGEAYGYAHFLGDRGILALRNPGPEPQVLRVVLDPAHGLASTASDLAAFATYPALSPLGHGLAAGDTIAVALAPFALSIVEIEPQAACPWPLIDGLDLDLVRQDGRRLVFAGTRSEPGRQPRLLNPERVRSWTLEGVPQPAAATAPAPDVTADPAAVTTAPPTARIDDEETVMIQFAGGDPVVLLRQDPALEEDFPELTGFVAAAGDEDARRPAALKVENRGPGWIWLSFPPDPTAVASVIRIAPPAPGQPWRGTCQQARRLADNADARFEVIVELAGAETLPPLPPQPRRHGWDLRIAGLQPALQIGDGGQPATKSSTILSP